MPIVLLEDNLASLGSLLPLLGTQFLAWRVSEEVLR